MKEYDVNKVKNIAFAGHNGSGKTSLTEAILYKAGASDRLGKTADGTTVCDYDPEEIKRKISIGTSLASFEYNDYKVNILDTPGLFDFAEVFFAVLVIVFPVVLALVAVNPSGSISLAK